MDVGLDCLSVSIGAAPVAGRRGKRLGDEDTMMDTYRFYVGNVRGGEGAQLRTYHGLL